MKFVVLLFLVGFASAASFYDDLDDAADDLVREFMLGMENSPALKEVFDLDDVLSADEQDEKIKTELGKKLQVAFEHLLEKIKEALDKGNTVKEDLLEKMKEVKEKLKDLKVDIGEKARELLGKIKERAKDFLKKILENLGLDKRSVEEETITIPLRAFDDLKRMFRNFKNFLKDSLKNLDKEAIKAKIEEIFGKGDELVDRFVQILKDNTLGKAKQKILELVDKLLGDDQDRGTRSLQELFEKIKEYFKNIGLEIKEKYFKFGEWVKETLKDKLTKGKDKVENLKQITKELLENTKEMGKDFWAEALEYLRQHKEDLGDEYDKLKEKVKDILSKKDA